MLVLGRMGEGTTVDTSNGPSTENTHTNDQEKKTERGEKGHNFNKSYAIRHLFLLEMTASKKKKKTTDHFPRLNFCCCCWPIKKGHKEIVIYKKRNISLQSYYIKKHKRLIGTSRYQERRTTTPSTTKQQDSLEIWKQNREQKKGQHEWPMSVRPFTLQTGRHKAAATTTKSRKEWKGRADERHKKEGGGQTTKDRKRQRWWISVHTAKEKKHHRDDIDQQHRSIYRYLSSRESRERRRWQGYCRRCSSHSSSAVNKRNIDGIIIINCRQWD